MAKLGISTGAAPDDGTGNSLLLGAAKINSNFDELYSLLGAGSTTTLSPTLEIPASLPSLTVSGVSTFTGAVNANSGVQIPDNKSILIGNDDDFEIYHNAGADTHIKNNSFTLEVRSDDTEINSKNNAISFVKANASGFMATTGITTISAATQTANVGSSGSITAYGLHAKGEIKVPNSVVITLGDSDDLWIWHDATNNSYIRNSTGDLNIRSNSTKLRSYADAQSYLEATEGSSIDLFFNGTKKLETTDQGTLTTGIASATSFSGNGGTLSGITTANQFVLGADGTNHYTFIGIGLTEVTNDPTLYLARGQKYEFVNNMGSHPFRIQNTVNGSVGVAYSNGVTNNDVSNGTLIFEVPFNAPNEVWYQCTAHVAMGGSITIYPSI